MKLHVWEFIFHVSMPLLNFELRQRDVKLLKPRLSTSATSKSRSGPLAHSRPTTSEWWRIEPSRSVRYTHSRSAPPRKRWECMNRSPTLNLRAAPSDLGALSGRVRTRRSHLERATVPLVTWWGSRHTASQTRRLTIGGDPSVAYGHQRCRSKKKNSLVTDKLSDNEVPRGDKRQASAQWEWWVGSFFSFRKDFFLSAVFAPESSMKASPVRQIR